jgi:hypothetical protein
MRKPYLVLSQNFQDELDRHFGKEWRNGIDIATAKTITAEDIQAIEKELR